MIEDDEKSIYDYEILDEEVIQINKEKLELNETYSKLDNKIIEDTKVLSELKQKIDNLK